VKKLTALLRLVVVLLRTSGFSFTHVRLPDGRAKVRILRAIDHACPFVPLRTILRFLRLSPSRFHTWRRLQRACTLDDQPSCPHTSPHRLTPAEIRTIKDMVTANEFRHVPTGTLAVLAQRLGKVWASPSTWYSLVRKFGWRRPRLRVQPAKAKVGIRTSQPNEMWHIDTTVIRLLDGTRAYLHAVIDNFSRRILAWRVADTFAPVNTVAVLVEAGRTAAPSETIPIVLADGGVENVNAHVDELISAGVLRRVLAFTELKFSNLSVANPEFGGSADSLGTSPPAITNPARFEPYAPAAHLMPRLACDTARDNAAANGTNGNSRGRNAHPPSMPAGDRSIPRAHDIRCSSAGTRGASSQGRLPSRRGCDPGTRVEWSRSDVRRKDVSAARKGRSCFFDVEDAQVRLPSVELEQPIMI
jgi:hypothetical protein